MTFLRKQFGCVKPVVLCFSGERRDDYTGLRNPHLKQHRIQARLGSRLQPTVYTSLAKAVLFYFAHFSAARVKVGPDLANLDADESPPECIFYWMPGITFFPIHLPFPVSDPRAVRPDHAFPNGFCREGLRGLKISAPPAVMATPFVPWGLAWMECQSSELRRVDGWRRSFR